jgi:hypothetical protein
MKYKTTQIIHLGTGKPFTFEVSPERLGLMKQGRVKVKAGKLPIPHTEQEFVTAWELSLFPAFENIRLIGHGNGYKDALMRKIAQDFGLSSGATDALLNNKEFIRDLQPWFIEIMHQRERAITTMSVIYRRIKAVLAPTKIDLIEFLDQTPDPVPRVIYLHKKHPRKKDGYKKTFLNKSRTPI